MFPEPYFDLEARTLADMLALGKWQPHEVANIERQIRDRRAQVEAGLATPTSRHWGPKLQELDKQLRLRWDFKQGWVIERAVPEWRCWAVCGVLGMRHVPYNLIDILRHGDMQRYSSPAAYLAEKREAAERVRKANDEASTNKVLAAVDMLTEKRVKEFLAVEKAVQTGETITAHGQTEKILDRMRQASFRAEQESDLHDESQSLNPSEHPLRQTRAMGGKHIRE